MRRIIVVLFFLVMIFDASAYFIGSAPSNQNLGEVERGETYEVNFYLTADSGQVLKLDPEITNVALDTLRNDRITRDQKNYDPEKVSHESISDWVSFKKETFTLDPETTEKAKVGGRGIQYNAKISFFLEIPRNAEPGYHVAKINFEPGTGEEQGQGMLTYGIANPVVVFRVPGEVNQELEVVGAEGLRAGDKKAYIDVAVRNTGSVTTLIEEGDLQIYDSNGGKKRKFSVSNRYIEPGQTKQIRLYWFRNKRDVKAGNYRIRGNVNYFTGTAFLDETFDITSFIQIEQNNETGGGIIPSTGDSEGDGLPVWLVAMFLILIGAIMYSFEIDPLLIILGLGAVGISIFILMSGLPVFLLGAVILMSLILFYYGWM